METLKQLDEQLFLYLNNLGNSTWDGFWLIITDQWMSIPLYALLVILIYVKTGFKKTVVTVGAIGALVIFTLVISRLVKYGVLRPRPCTLDLPMRYPLNSDCGDYGFFSTHASVGMALMLFIGKILKEYYRYILWPLMTWVVLFCVSRIYVGKHYPGDIIVGFAVGIVVGLIFYRIRMYVLKKYGY